MCCAARLENTYLPPAGAGGAGGGPGLSTPFGSRPGGSPGFGGAPGGGSPGFGGGAPGGGSPGFGKKYFLLRTSDRAVYKLIGQTRWALLW